MDENKISENLENTENNEVSVVKKDENPNKITLFEIFGPEGPLRRQGPRGL